jgi:hypothetical protein
LHILNCANQRSYTCSVQGGADSCTCTCVDIHIIVLTVKFLEIGHEYMVHTIGSNTTYSTGRDMYVFGTSKRACDLKFYLDIDHQLPTSIKFGSSGNHNN